MKIKIEMNDVTQGFIIAALEAYDMHHLANWMRTAGQDPAADGPEVAILSGEHGE